MRRWQLCLALSFLASSTSLPAADAVMSAGQEAGSIVSGVLADSTDNSVTGGVDLFAWPTGRAVQEGQTLQLLPAGHDRAAKDGRFSIAGDLTPDLVELARLNGGYVNFVLEATAGGVVEETHFSRYVGDIPVAAQDAGSRKQQTEWRASPEESAVPLRVRIEEAEGGTAAGDRIAPMQGGCYGLRRVETQIRETVVGELRAPQDTVEAFFAYGERADSEIGVSARWSGGRWGADGSFHVANSDETDVKKWAQSGEHLLVTARFMYDRYEYDCPAGRREKVVPREWMGDMQAQPTAVRGCEGAPQEHVGQYAAGVEFNRQRDKAVEWAGAANVFGAELSARSGYSRWVRGHWKFGNAPMHLLCGNDGPPKRASHIFAGR